MGVGGHIDLTDVGKITHTHTHTQAHIFVKNGNQSQPKKHPFFPLVTTNTHTHMHTHTHTLTHTLAHTCTNTHTNTHTNEQQAVCWLPGANSSMALV